MHARFNQVSSQKPGFFKWLLKKSAVVDLFLRFPRQPIAIELASAIRVLWNLGE